MSEKKRGMFAAIRSAIDETVAEVKQVGGEFIADTKAEWCTPVPPANAAVSEKVDYLETARVYVGPDKYNGGDFLDGDFDFTDLSTGDHGAPYDFIRLGVAPALIALCRANLATNPALVEDLVEPLLARQRRYGYGKPLLGLRDA